MWKEKRKVINGIVFVIVGLILIIGIVKAEKINAKGLSVSYYRNVEVYSRGSFTVSGSSNWTVYTLANRKFKNPNLTSNGKSIITLSKNGNKIKYHGDNAGTVRVYVRDNYTGVEVSFDVKVYRRDISHARIILKRDSYVYDNSAKRPGIESVTINGGTVPIYNYRIVKYTDNVKAGLARIYIEGLGNNCGTAYTNFVISKRNISGGKIKLRQDTFTYAAKPITPLIDSVTINGGRTPISDYRITYQNNKNAGTGTVIVTGTGSNTGTIKKSFYIQQRDISNGMITLDEDEFVYDGKEKKPKAIAWLSRVEIKEVSVEYKNNVNPGTATVIVKGTGGNKGALVKTFTIKKRDISRSTVTLSQDTYIYDGKAKKPGVIVKLGGATVKNILIEYKNNVKPGTATVIIKGNGANTGTVRKSFNIVKALYANVKNESGNGYTKTITVGNRKYNVYNQGAFYSNYGSIGSGGCSITSMAIVLSGYRQNKTPTDIASKLHAVTITITDIANGMKGYGVNATAITNNNAENNTNIKNKAKNDIDNNLKIGKPVIILVRQNRNKAAVRFSEGGEQYTLEAHYIVLVGYGQNGKPVVADPNSGQVHNLHSLDTIINDYIYAKSDGGYEQGYVLIN